MAQLFQGLLFEGLTFCWIYLRLWNRKLAILHNDQIKYQIVQIKSIKLFVLVLLTDVNVKLTDFEIS